MTKMISNIGIGMIATAAACAAPASSGPNYSSVSKADDPRMGPEVDSICFQRSINNWDTVDGQDDVILLERGVNNWYRVELLGACSENVLRFANVIGIKDHSAGGCIRMGDTILVEDSPERTRNCSVRRIYEWDKDAPAPETED